MGQIITYVCDISGKSSQDKTEFAEITISGVGFGDYNFNYPDKPRNYYQSNSTKKTVTKFVAKEIAEKFNLLAAKEDPATPEVTFESQLVALFREWKEEIVYEASEAAIQSVRN